MSISFAVHRAFEKKARRNDWNLWPKMYVAVDLHDVIITGTYNRENIGATFFPDSLKVLKYLSDDPRFCLILFSSSHREIAEKFLANIKKEHGVTFDYFNENPECDSTELCDFSKKMYFDILLEDKAGFDARIDWSELWLALQAYDFKGVDLE